MTTCFICERLLNDLADPVRSRDCGGDCLQCMADAGDPECIKSLLAWRTVAMKYHEREIFRRGGQYVQCQILNWQKGPPPKYLVCHPLSGDHPTEFVARHGMGTWMEIDPVLELPAALNDGMHWIPRAELERIEIAYPSTWLVWTDGGPHDSHILVWVGPLLRRYLDRGDEITRGRVLYAALVMDPGGAR